MRASFRAQRGRTGIRAIPYTDRPPSAQGSARRRASFHCATRPSTAPSPTAPASERASTGPTLTGRACTEAGCARTKPGRDRSKPGRGRTKPGRDRSKSGRDRSKSGRDRSKSGRDRTEPGRDRTEPGRDRTNAAAPRAGPSRSSRRAAPRSSSRPPPRSPRAPAQRARRPPVPPAAQHPRGRRCARPTRVWRVETRVWPGARAGLSANLHNIYIIFT